MYTNRLLAHLMNDTVILSGQNTIRRLLLLQFTLVEFFSCVQMDVSLIVSSELSAFARALTGGGELGLGLTRGALRVQRVPHHGRIGLMCAVRVWGPPALLSG